MLFTINNGNVPGCPYRQDDIAHLVTTVEDVVAANLPFVFYDYNATLGIATPYNQIADLSRIDWPLFFEVPLLGGYCKYWKSDVSKQKYVLRMETRQAEFLVHASCPLNLVRQIGVSNNAKAAEVTAILQKAGVNIPVAARPEWYF